MGTLSERGPIRISDDRTLYVERYGSGPPLVLLHGYSQSSSAWHGLIDQFPMRELILVDLPGHGRSSPFEDGFSADAATRDLIALFAQLGLTAIDAIGFSFGGDLLFQLAARTDLLRAAVAISATGSWHAADYPDLVRQFTRETVDISSFHPNDTTIDAVFRDFRHYSVEISDTALERIDANFLVVVGDADPVTPLERIVHVHRLLERSSLWVVPNTAHAVHAGGEQDRFVEITKAFLAKFGLG